jgi:hypothetical protein
MGRVDTAELDVIIASERQVEGGLEIVQRISCLTCIAHGCVSAGTVSVHRARQVDDDGGSLARANSSGEHTRS